MVDAIDQPVVNTVGGECRYPQWYGQAGTWQFPFGFEAVKISVAGLRNEFEDYGHAMDVDSSSGMEEG